VQGVATFPSFHAAGAIVYISAVRGIRFLFPFFIVINILMLISTMPIGGHHLADMLSGIALALITIGTVRILMWRNGNATQGKARPHAVSTSA
jgi:membrane-associated phospholipid phosphatase